MNIDDMPAGREMDALVAEKVMGWTKCKVAGPYNYSGDRACEPHFTHEGKAPKVYFERTRVEYGPVPNFSTEIADAWSVVIEMGKTSLLDHIEQRGEDEWAVQFCAKPDQPWWHTHSVCSSVSLAICRAALKAVS